MLARCRFPVLVIAAAGAWMLACDNAPTQNQPDVAPQFHHRPGHGGGGGGDGGDSGGEEFPIIAVFSDDLSFKIRSDGRGPYVDGKCGVTGDLGNFDDLRLGAAARLAGKDRKDPDCDADGDGTGEPRTLIFDWPDKPLRNDKFFMNTDQVSTVVGGATELRSGQFTVCNRLVFNPDDSEFPGNGSDLLEVTFDEGDPADPNDDAWTVRTQDGGNDKGFCVGDGVLRHMPFSVRITRK